MRIFLDANTLFSAAKSAGAIRRLLAELHAANHLFAADGYVVIEARRNVSGFLGSESKFASVQSTEPSGSAFG